MSDESQSQVGEHKLCVHTYEKEFTFNKQSDHGMIYWFPMSRVFGLYIYNGFQFYETVLTKTTLQEFLKNTPSTAVDAKFM
jgi:hypothetical protein